ncbi:MAG: type II toxin-antitoxin system RelE/ParE family toxin [Bacteroidota bacterium]
MARVRLTHRALFDIEDILDYSKKEWGLSAAENYLFEIEKSFDLISKNPGILSTNSKISTRFKVYQVKKHWLICEVIRNDVFILTIKHMSMDLIKRLKELEPSLELEVETLFKTLEARNKN